ncbi:hypothetical protein, partial [Acinetobacter baumannii]|uniref:hypothetical protein n=1 Tax=Acinetobacter baumannii TaxID=470 RepID=UPI001AECE4BE
EETYRDNKVLPKSEILIVAEAHKLAQSLEQKNMDYLSFKFLYKLLKQVKDVEVLLESLNEEQDKELKKIIELLSLLSIDAKDNIQWLETFLIQLGQLNEKISERNLKELANLNSWPTAMKKNLKEIFLIFGEINQLAKSINDELTSRVDFTSV